MPANVAVEICVGEHGDRQGMIAQQLSWRVKWVVKLKNEHLDTQFDGMGSLLLLDFPDELTKSLL